MSCNYFNHPKVTVINTDQNRRYVKCIECYPLDRYESVIPEVNLDFDNIIGFDEIKDVMKAVVENSFTESKRTHLALLGDPSTAKTVFLKTVQKNLNRYGFKAHYLNAEATTSAGVIDYLFNHDVEYLSLDELDKMKKPDQAVLLNLLEYGTLQETKFKKTRLKVMDKFVCFASGNYASNILEPLLTRFLVMYVKAYSEQEFYWVGTLLLQREPFYKSLQIARYIVENVWFIMQNYRHEYPVIRNAVQVATLSGNDKASVDIILRGLKTHSTKYDEIDR